MKFLLFNAVVVAALAYLFTMERGDFRDAADSLHRTVEQVRDSAEDIADKAKRAAPAVPSPLSEAETEVEEEAPPLPEPRPEVAAAAPAPEPAPEPTKAPAPLLAGDLPPVADPAVAQRRAEVLDGLLAADPAPLPDVLPDALPPELALAEGEVLMSPQERVRELNLLAEEMELLFVSKMGQ